MSAKLYLREGTTLTWTADGNNATVQSIVPASLLTGTDLNRFVSAMQNADVPQLLGSISGADNLSCVAVSARAVGANVMLLATFAPPTAINRQADDNDSGIIEVGSTMITTTSMRDSEGVPYTLIYTYSEGPYKGRTVPQLGEVEEQIPHTTISVTRRVITSPLLRSITYTGAVNAFAWQGFAPKTMIVSTLRGTSTDGGDTYTEYTELIYRPETWKQTIVYRDNLGGGGVPADVFDQPDAFLDREPPRLVDFASLGLPLVTI